LQIALAMLATKYQRDDVVAFSGQCWASLARADNAATINLAGYALHDARRNLRIVAAAYPFRQ
jgi:hypothetical protein